MRASRIDLTGRVFGRLRVLRAGPRRCGEKPRWICRCGCGEETSVRVDHLLSGATRSCGRRHLRGQQIGALRVLERAPNVLSRTGSLPKGLTAWFCQCACSRVIVVTTANLTRTAAPPTTHCGCLRLKPAVALPSPDRTAPPVEVPLRMTTAQQALDRFHDEHSPIGRVRRVCRPVEDDPEAGGLLHEFDPFE